VGTPNLFLAGFPKAGTTGLYYYLDAHPDVYCNPYIKEPRFFSSSYFNKKDRRFCRNIIMDEAKYLRLFRDSNDRKYIADGSVYYTHFRGIASRIRDFSPDAKVILCIRNPVDRFRSHCMMEIKETGRDDSYRGFIDRPELESGVNILKAGMYAPAINEYYDVFGRDRVYIAVFDDLLDDIGGYYKGICDFLGIPFVPVEDKIINESVILKNKFAMAFLRFVKRNVPGFLIRKMKFRTKLKFNDLFYKNTSAVNEPMPLEVRRELLEYYRDDIGKTGELIGRNLDGWLT